MSTVELFLDKLDVTVSLDVTGLIQEKPHVIAIEHDAVADVDVSLEVMQKLFQIGVDGFDDSDTGKPTRFYVVNDKIPSSLDVGANSYMTKYPIGDTDINGNNYPTSYQSIKFDFVRYLAEKLFNTHYAVDLFTNQVVLRDDVGDNVNTGYKTTICDLMKKVSTTGDHSGLLSPPVGDPDGKFLTEDTSGNDNLCRELYLQLVSKTPSRFNALIKRTTKQPLPLLEGDTIGFRVIVNPATDQHQIIDPSNNPILPRKYLVRFKLVEEVSIPTPPGPPQSEKIVEGGIFTSNAELERLRGCTTINGNVQITRFTQQPDFSVFDNLEVINGTGEGDFGKMFTIYNNNVSFSIVDKFNKLTKCNSSFYILQCNLLKSISGFGALTTVTGLLEINKNLALTTITGFSALTTVSDYFAIQDNSALTTITGFSALTTVGEYFIIGSNSALTAITGFSALQTVGGSFGIRYNSKLSEISGFTSLTPVTGINGNVIISDNSSDPKLNVSLDTYTAINSARGTGNFTDTNSFTIKTPEKIVDGGMFRSNAELERLRGCTTINGYVYIINDLNGSDSKGGFTNANPPDFSVFDNLETINGTKGEFSNKFIISINDVSFNIVDKFNKLTKCDSSFYITRCNLLESISGFSALTTVTGFFEIQNNSALTTIPGFSALTTVDDYFAIHQNSELTTIQGFGALQTVGGIFGIRYNSKLSEISGFTSLTPVTGIKGDVNIKDNSSTPKLNVSLYTYNAINSAKGKKIFTDTNSFTTFQR